MADCAGWSFGIMNGVLIFPQFACGEVGGKMVYSKKNPGVAINLLLPGSCPLVARHVTGVLWVLPPIKCQGPPKWSPTVFNDNDCF